MKSPLEQRPAFAPAQAFVVQFGRETDLDTGRMAGRVEHVVSRKAGRFQSVDELMAFMTEVLREVASTLHHPC
jgi:hypothetical protein